MASAMHLIVCFRWGWTDQGHMESELYIPSPRAGTTVAGFERGQRAKSIISSHNGTHALYIGRVEKGGRGVLSFFGTWEAAAAASYVSTFQETSFPTPLTPHRCFLSCEKLAQTHISNPINPPPLGCGFWLGTHHRSVPGLGFGIVLLRF